MARTRSGSIAVVVVVLVGLGVWPAAFAPPTFAAVVAWPPSTLVVSEIQTGGASASDEFVEVANQGPGAVDLAGLEVVYATSSGSTVTRKATWTVPTTLEPGRRVLLANAAGAYSRRSPTSRIRAVLRRPAARWRCEWSAGRRSMRSAGAMRRTRSSRARPLRLRPPGRASSGHRAERPATAGTRTTTPSTGSSRPFRRRRGWPPHQSRPRALRRTRVRRRRRARPRHRRRARPRHRPRHRRPRPVRAPRPPRPPRRSRRRRPPLPRPRPRRLRPFRSPPPGRSPTTSTRSSPAP